MLIIRLKKMMFTLSDIQHLFFRTSTETRNAMLKFADASSIPDCIFTAEEIVDRITFLEEKMKSIESALLSLQRALEHADLQSARKIDQKMRLHADSYSEKPN